MRRTTLMLAALAVALFGSSSSGAARTWGMSQRSEVCAPVAQPLCMQPLAPVCGASGWRCVAPPGLQQPSRRSSESCAGNLGPSCMYPLLPTCRGGRWVCAASGAGRY